MKPMISIRIRPETHKRLKEFAAEGRTLDRAINDLLDKEKPKKKE